MQLLQTKKDINDEEYKLYNDDGTPVVDFDVEISGGGRALISYITRKEFRNKGYASVGLQQLRDSLFGDSNIIFLELINLSGDYSRKVAENAGFFSPSHSPDYYVCLNPNGEHLLEQQLEGMDISSLEFKEKQRTYAKLKRLRVSETQAKEEMQSRLEELLQHSNE